MRPIHIRSKAKQYVRVFQTNSIIHFGMLKNKKKKKHLRIKSREKCIVACIREYSRKPIILLYSTRVNITVKGKKKWCSYLQFRKIFHFDTFLLDSCNVIFFLGQVCQHVIKLYPFA